MSDTRIRILLADDDPALLRLLSKWLGKAGYETLCVSDGESAIASIQAEAPNMLITDWEMPRLDGIGLCEWLRSQHLPTYVYTIFLTSKSDSADMVRALEAGADDFLKKPVDRSELQARVRSGIRVLELESRLSVLAKTDPLTGLATRRTFHELMEREWSRAHRHYIPLSCVMMDIDYFKNVNDNFGHRVGDDVLRQIARILKESCRASDVVARYGGEEFVVLLPETTEQDAVHWADRVRSRIEGKRFKTSDEHSITATASFGVAQRLADTATAEQLIDLADQALLVGKRSGRNRVIGFQSLGDSKLKETDRPHSLFDGLTARHVMATVVASLREDDTVGHAARFFLRFRLNSAPIINKDGDLVGILSERDVMSVMLFPKWWTTKIASVMKRNVVCYDETTPVVNIYEFLCRVSVRALVIVNGTRPTGMITRGSLLRWFTNMLSVNPNMEAEGPALGGDPNLFEAMLPEPSQNVAMIARAIVGEAENLEYRAQHDGGDLVPAVIGGVSRIEELLNDLLTYLRCLQSSAKPHRIDLAQASKLHEMAAMLECADRR